MGTGEQWLGHWSSKLEKNRLRVFLDLVMLGAGVNGKAWPLSTIKSAL